MYITLVLGYYSKKKDEKEKKEIMTSAEARLEPILSSLGVKEAVLVVVVARTRILFSCK